MVQNRTIHILFVLALAVVSSVMQMKAAGQTGRTEEVVADSLLTNESQVPLKDEEACLQRERELRAQLLTKNGAELLDTYAELYDLLTYMGAIDKQFELSENYLQEAERQNNVKAIRYARLSRFYELYNNSLYTDMARVIEDDLAFYVKTKQWQAYYSEWTLYLQACLMRGRFSTALYGAQKMWEEAQKGNNNFGRGCSRFLIGRVNREMGRHKEASADLLQAIKYLRGYIHIDDNTLMDAYTILLDLYFDEGEYGKMIYRLNEMMRLIETWKHPKKGDSESDFVYNDRLTFIYSYYVRAFLGQKNYDKAKQVLAKAKNINARMSDEKTVSLRESEALYNQYTGDYQKAIDLYMELMENYEDGQDSISLFHSGMLMAGCYEGLGDYQMAADMYRSMQDLQEKMRYTTSSWLMLDYKSEQNERAEAWETHTERVVLFGLISIGVLVLAIVVVCLSMHFRFKRYRRLMDLALLRNMGLRGEEVISRAQERAAADSGPMDKDPFAGDNRRAERLMRHLDQLGEGDDARSVLDEIDQMAGAYAHRPRREEESHSEENDRPDGVEQPDGGTSGDKRQ